VVENGEDEDDKLACVKR